jgi:hypothetical protein
MAQAGHSAPADSVVPGDIKTALMSGRYFSETLHRVNCAAEWLLAAVLRLPTESGLAHVCKRLRHLCDGHHRFKFEPPKRNEHSNFYFTLSTVLQ